MVNVIVVQLLVFLLSLQVWGKVDRVHQEGYLGEKRLDSYSERYQPLIFQDIYQGKMSFADELFFKSFFDPYLLPSEHEMAFFLRSELNGGMICSNEQISEHFDEIRYSYRLITLSYLIEGQWHMNLMSKQLLYKNGCDFDLNKWIGTCRPKTDEMKKFVGTLKKFSPNYDEKLPLNYSKSNWWKEFKAKNYKWYSHYRLNTECKGKCYEDSLEKAFKHACSNDQELMTLICSEQDDVYGLSHARDAYFLLGQSNIINTYNKRGEAMGCLRRFSELMSHKEVVYDGLIQLFPALQSYLKEKYQERFLQGRVFFYGSGKEFEEKGLTDLYVKEQPIQIAKAPDVAPEPEVKAPVKVAEAKPEVKKVEAPVEVIKPKKVEEKEIRKPVKSAFLIAAEIREQGNLDRAEVDMLKFKYDYVFSLNMINTLSDRLKTFMTREALTEMMNYDKLGTKEGPVPLLFIKFMIDMQEHQGLWNVISVLGDKFYVSNEIDSEFSPGTELIQLVNDESSGRQWQLFVLKP